MDIQSLQIIAPLGAFLSAVGALGAAIFTYGAVKQAEKSRRAQVFIEVIHRYNDVYFKRTKALQENFNWKQFNEDCPKLVDKLGSEKLGTLRDVAIAFEQMGVLVKNGELDSTMLFDTIFINPSRTPGGETLWEHVRELICNMRDDYNLHQWENWEYLVHQEKMYLERRKNIDRKALRQARVGVAKLRNKRYEQARIDHTYSSRQLQTGRDLLLPTTGNVPEGSGRTPLDYVAAELERMVKGKAVTIISYSGRNHPHREPHDPTSDSDFARAAEKAANILAPYGARDYIFLYKQENKALAIAEAEVIYATGGNTSRHIANLTGRTNFDGSPIDNAAGANVQPLQYVLRLKVAKGTPYIGVSAGQMIAAGNGIPHLDPPAPIHIERTRFGEWRISLPFEGLDLLENFGLAIQPHYEPDKPTNYGDETQFHRLEQIIEMQTWLTILGLEDDTALKAQGNRMALIGNEGKRGYLLSWNKELKKVTSEKIKIDADLSQLLDTNQRIRVRKRLERQ